jgi:hypothetical protein
VPVRNNQRSSPSPTAYSCLGSVQCCRLPARHQFSDSRFVESHLLGSCQSIHDSASINCNACDHIAWHVHTDHEQIVAHFAPGWVGRI